VWLYVGLARAAAAAAAAATTSDSRDDDTVEAVYDHSLIKPNSKTTSLSTERSFLGVGSPPPLLLDA
jgi:hypothetical protein